MKPGGAGLWRGLAASNRPDMPRSNYPFLPPEHVVVTNALPFLRRYDRAPLIQPILFKTAVYWAVVFVARLLEHFARFSLIEHNRVGDFLPHMIATFHWHRFVAIQLWILVLFLIYVTASELNHLFGDGQLRRILFTHRP